MARRGSLLGSGICAHCVTKWRGPAVVLLWVNVVSCGDIDRRPEQRRGAGHHYRRAVGTVLSVVRVELGLFAAHLFEDANMTKEVDDAGGER